jgi:hypothetical protein
MTNKEQKVAVEFMDEVNLCLKRTSGIKRLMGRLEKALKDLDEEDSNEIALSAIQDLNMLLGGLIIIWDQWASGVSIELDRLIQYK